MPYGMDAFMLGIGMLGTCWARTCDFFLPAWGSWGLCGRGFSSVVCPSELGKTASGRLAALPKVGSLVWSTALLW